MRDGRNAERKILRLREFDYSSNRAYFVTVCTKNRKRLWCDIVKAEGAPEITLVHDRSASFATGLTKYHHREGSCGSSVGATLCGRPGHPHEMLAKWFQEVEHKFDGAWIDLFVIMPDHIHFVVVIDRTGERSAEGVRAAGDHTGSPLQRMGERSAETETEIENGLGERSAKAVSFPGDHTGSPLQRMGERSAEEMNRSRQEYDLFDIVGWFKTMTTNEYIRGVKAGSYQPFDKKLWQRGYYEHIIRDDDDWYEIRRYVTENPIRWLIDEKEPFELKETKVE